MKYIKTTYDVENINYKTLYEYGFRKTYNGEFIYKFIVYKYNKKKPLLFCEFTLYEEEKQILISVKDIVGNSYNYNKEEFGMSKLIETVNRKIYKELNLLKKKGIIC